MNLNNRVQTRNVTHECKKKTYFSRHALIICDIKYTMCNTNCHNMNIQRAWKVNASAHVHDTVSLHKRHAYNIDEVMLCDDIHMNLNITDIANAQ